MLKFPLLIKKKSKRKSQRYDLEKEERSEMSQHL